jgi:hypothetical protein
MAWIRRRGNSYSLIESFRENGKVRQRYLCTLTPAEAEALRGKLDHTPRPAPSAIRTGINPWIIPHSLPPIDINGPAMPTAPSPIDTTLPRLPAPPLTGRERCQMCELWLPLGGRLCPECTGPCSGGPKRRSAQAVIGEPALAGGSRCTAVRPVAQESRTDPGGCWTER